MHNVQVILSEITADFSSKKYGDQSSMQWYIQSAITKRPNCTSNKISFKNGEDIQINKCEQNLRKCITSKLALQELLKGVLQDT